MRRRLPAYGVFAVLLLLAPYALENLTLFTLSSGVLMTLLAIGSLGMVPLTGAARQVSLGQAAFYGIGGYASAILTTRYDVNPWLGILAGAVLSAAVAWVLGSVIFRIQGHYLSLATLAFGLALAALANEVPFTGRNAGISGIPALSLFGFAFDDDRSTYYLFAGILLVAIAVVHLVLGSAFGRSLTAAGDSPIAAAASGINIKGLRRTAFVISAVTASVAGSGYAHWYRFVDPSMLGILASVQLLIIVTVGGRESVWGAPLGAFAVVTLAQAAQQLPSAGASNELTAYGIVLILSLLLLPRGLAGVPAMVARVVRR
nr:branched-chain amino acid ABC transporter permease [uncultured Actinoplanes sp.]